MIETLASQVALLILSTINDKVSMDKALSIGVRGYLIESFIRKQLSKKVFFVTEKLCKEQQSGIVKQR